MGVGLMNNAGSCAAAWCIRPTPMDCG